MQAEVYEYFLQNQKELLICEDEKEAAACEQVLKFMGYAAFCLPDFRASFGEDLRSYMGELAGISTALSAFYKANGKKILISPVRTILNKLPAASHLRPLNIKFGSELSLSELKEEILRLGYDVRDIVESMGEVSFRGEIIDIFSVGSESAIRILLDGETVESIRRFDIATQKSEKDELVQVEIAPFLANLSEDEFESVSEKISRADSDALARDLGSLGFWFIEGFVDYVSAFDCVLLHEIKKDEIFSERNLDFLDAIEVLPAARKFKDLAVTPSQEFFEFHRSEAITLIARNDALLAPFDLGGFSNIEILREDFVVNLISAERIILSLNKASPKKRVRRSSLALDELNVGDFVVHEDHGIAKFNGLELIEVMGCSKEFVSLLYEDGDKLLLPVEYLNKIDRYVECAKSSLRSLQRSSHWLPSASWCEGSSSKMKARIMRNF